jgi:antitoxin (DNA-binding transcriptional repressor) of toxin-antitoxin stability system
MVAVRISELKERADEIVRRLRETGEPVRILDDDSDARVVATLVPATEADQEAELAEDEEVRRWLAEMDKLGEEIAASVPPGTTLEDFIRDIRRDP